MATADDLGIESVQDIVENVFGLTGSLRGDEFDMLCPNPQHSDRNPSCSVNLNTGLWNCFSCGSGGDLIRLGALVLDEATEDIEQLLKPSSAEALLSAVQRKLHRLEVHNHIKRPIELPGDEYTDGPYDDLLERGFLPSTLKRWGVKYVEEQQLQGKKGEFSIYDCHALPIRDKQGHLLCWQYRKTRRSPSWQPKYLDTPGVDINELWFGMQLHHSARSIIIVEGPLDAMWVDQCGFPALAMLGGSMGDRKLMQLQRYREVYLLGDRDNAGLKATMRIGTALGARVPLFVMTYPGWIDATDPQELHPVDLEIMIERAVPWAVWSMRIALNPSE